jgi:hypothetical protein
MRAIYFAPLLLATLAVGLTTTLQAQPRPKAKASQPSASGQTVNPAPVTYWMDLSTGSSSGGGGMMGSLMGAMMSRGASSGALGGSGDSWFGAANAGANGQHADIAVFDRRQPGSVTASQAIPDVARMGASLPLLPPPPPSTSPPTKREPREPVERDLPEGRFKITLKAYWGCGPSVRTGQPRVQVFDSADPRSFGVNGQGVASRNERERGAMSNTRSSIWPNQTSNRTIPNGTSMLGDHRVTGAGLPTTMAFNITPEHDFMPSFGLRSSGQKSGVITLNWTNIPTASAYFAAASGTAFQQGPSGNNDQEMTIVSWSASELPENGTGLIDYLSNTNQETFLRDKVILPSTTTSCQIPSGIFQDAMMINISGIAYGRELNLVHPARPDNPRIPWNQEWTARVRVKSQASIMMLGDVMGSNDGRSRGRRGNAAALAPAENLPRCREPAPTAKQVAGRAILGAVTGGLLSGRSRTQEQPGVNCTP